MHFLTRNTLLLAVISTMFSCGSDDDPTAAKVDVTFLKVGAKYTYYYDDGLWNMDTLKSVVEAEVATDTFLMRHYSETISVSPTQYFVVKDNNLYASVRLRDPSTYWIECKFGVPVGTTWNVLKNKTLYTYTIDALNVSVKTGDGVVNDAIKIKLQSGSSSAYSYVSPTVGLIGNGSVDEDVVTKLIHYKIPTTPSTPISKNLPPISYGTFPFLAVGKYWNYVTTDILGTTTIMKIKVESKDASKNIYKVSTEIDGDIDYTYWYEDNGLLMVYEEGENVLNADPIYMEENKASLGYGWAGLAPTGTIFIYKITKLNESVDTGFFGTLSCMEISVSNGFIGSQFNYWNKSKGYVSTEALLSTVQVQSSNARRAAAVTYMPMVMY